MLCYRVSDSPSLLIGLACARTVAHILSATAPSMASLVASSAALLPRSPSSPALAGAASSLSPTHMPRSQSAATLALMDAQPFNSAHALLSPSASAAALHTPPHRRLSTAASSASAHTASASKLFPPRPQSASPSAGAYSPAPHNLAAAAAAAAASYASPQRPASAPRRSPASAASVATPTLSASPSYHSLAVAAGRVTSPEQRALAEHQWRDGVAHAPPAHAAVQASAAQSPEARHARRLSVAAERTGNATVIAVRLGKFLICFT